MSFEQSIQFFVGNEIRNKNAIIKLNQLQNRNDGAPYDIMQKFMQQENGT